MHPDADALQRFAHRELAGAADLHVRTHLVSCADCRARALAVMQLDDGVGALLRTVDHPPPHVNARHVARRARSGGAVWLRRAAGIVLMSGVTGIAYAAPGSPLRAFVERATRWISPPPITPSVAPVTPARESVRPSGIAIVPGKQLLVQLAEPRSDGEIRVTLTDSAAMTVLAATPNVSYTSAADRLSIELHGSPAVLLIAVPRGAARVEIRVGAHVLFLKEGTHITSPAPDRDGTIHLPIKPIP